MVVSGPQGGEFEDAGIFDRQQGEAHCFDLFGECGKSTRTLPSPALIVSSHKDTLLTKTSSAASTTLRPSAVTHGSRACHQNGKCVSGSSLTGRIRGRRRHLRLLAGR